MRKLIFLILLTHALLAQSEQSNILTYYAVDNSIDGQIMIEKINYLRFVPVFAIREKVQKVTVSIYSGSLYYTREALPSTDSTYWQSILPQFSLGDVIQRVEVEVKFALDDNSIFLKEKLHQAIEDSKEELNTKSAEYNSKLEDISKTLSKSKSQADALSRTLCNQSRDITLLTNPDLGKNIQQGFEDLQETHAKLKKYIDNRRSDSTYYLTDLYCPGFPSLIEKIETLNAKVESIKPIYNAFNATYTKVNETVLKYINDLDIITKSNDALVTICREKISGLKTFTKNFIDSVIVKSIFIRDSIQSNVYSKIAGNLVDKDLTGQSVQKSDVVVDLTANTARILYRNYKSANRKMPAIDPKEKFGIFRGRFIPLPVTCTDGKGKMQLLDNKKHLVFEFGVAFGDMTVPGDEFVPAEFSINRFSMVLGLTEMLFDENAPVIAAALSYDVNSYVSVGGGVNLARKTGKPYLSMGINKRAFEALMKSALGAFK
ncbi:MAG: hypothetical protein HYV28_18005 [Ignavibacteriales bacterium]|nr:hypothetical protein [Ignavibacteriales bacterium]